MQILLFYIYGVLRLFRESGDLGFQIPVEPGDVDPVRQKGETSVTAIDTYNGTTTNKWYGLYAQQQLLRKDLLHISWHLVLLILTI